MFFRFLSGRARIFFEAGFALKVILSPVKGLMPSRALVAGFLTTLNLATPGIVTFGLRSQLIFVALGAWFLFPAERAVMRTARYLVGFALLITGLMPVLFGGEFSLGGANGSGVLMAVCSVRVVFLVRLAAALVLLAALFSAILRSP